MFPSYTMKAVSVDTVEVDVCHEGETRYYRIALEALESVVHPEYRKMSELARELLAQRQAEHDRARVSESMSRCAEHSRSRIGPDRCFGSCVSRTDCDPRAHGNIVYDEICKCGAVRTVAVNQQFIEHGVWHNPIWG